MRELMHPALARVRETLVPGGDTRYFTLHNARFERHLDALLALLPSGGRLLDIGSHYLHLSAALRLAGADVVAMDVSEFQSLDFVRARAAMACVPCVTVSDLGAGDFLSHERDGFDGAVFCEILEHITFNPVRMWHRVYDLLKPGGFIYLTTPNSLRLANVLRTAGRLTGRRGVGVPVAEIFEHVTFGHHWKEYSAHELREYFRRLSPDFVVQLRDVDFGWPANESAALSRFVRKLGALVPGLRPSLEATIRLPRKTAWLARPKGYEE